MPNTFLTPDIIAREALMLLRSNMVASRLFTRRYEADLNPGAKVGDSIRIRRREKGNVTEYTSGAVTPETRTESPINLTLEKHFDTTREISTREATLDLADFSSQVLAPEVLELAERVDQYALTKLWDIPNPGPAVAFNTDASTGGASAALSTLLSLPNSTADMATHRQTLNQLKIPTRPRFQIASPEYEATLLSVDAFTKVNESGADGALRDADIGILMGIATFMDQNVDTTTHTSGTQTGGLLNGAGAIGATSLPYDTGNVASGTVLVGDLVKIDGYGWVTIAANNTASTGAGTLTIKEPLRAAVADNAGFTVLSGTAGGDTYKRHGAIFHPDCLAFVAAPLAQPMEAGIGAVITDEETNLSIRVVKSYDVLNKRDIISMDVLVGALMVDGRLGTQVLASV